MTKEQLATWAGALEERPPHEILALAAERFAPRIAFATGFGREGCVLLDLIARHRFPIEVFTLDTGVLFPETYALWERLERRYGIVVRAVRPPLDGAAEGPRPWETDPARCCERRKVEPLRGELSRHDAWVTAIRRDQTAERAAAQVADWDERFGLVKVNPLAGWTARDVDDYVARHGVEVNPLHARGYPSIGCEPCTTPAAPGEGPRAGRWRGRESKECGLHSRYAWATGAPLSVAKRDLDPKES